ncbi:hypothetical protein GCM10009759_37070 [Kitasatospora saccharophila]|uniref:Uncharacterized protein n=1 Tax=Kitasatospora saccharophila TaxID=407973 RepID=A0ABN2X0Y4_9ACTN
MCFEPPPPQAASRGVITAAPATETAAVTKDLRFSSVLMVGRPFRGALHWALSKRLTVEALDVAATLTARFRLDKCLDKFIFRVATGS